MSALADAFMRIRNADGGEVAACGNATRCVAALLMREKGGTHAVIETAAGLLDAEAAGDGLISVDMGRGRASTGATSRWPRRRTRCTSASRRGRCAIRSRVNVGNPHAVFFVDDAERAPIERVRPGGRAASAVSGAHQRRGGAGAGARPPPAARLGARRRADPRLRHRRLRRRRRRRPARPRPSAASPSCSTAAACASTGCATITC